MLVATVGDGSSETVEPRAFLVPLPIGDPSICVCGRQATVWVYLIGFPVWKRCPVGGLRLVRWLNDHHRYGPVDCT